MQLTSNRFSPFQLGNELDYRGMVDVSNELIDNNEQFYGMAISTSEHNFGDGI